MSDTVDSSAHKAAGDGPAVPAGLAPAPVAAPVPPAPEPASPVLEAMELHLLTINECFVYAIPRLATATGYRAEDWGLAHPLVTGALKCYRRGDDRLFLRIYASPPAPSSSSQPPSGPGDGKDGVSGGGGGGRPRTPRLFAEAPIYLGNGPKGEPPAPLQASFVPVTDSSRYFVIKAVDPSASASGASRARHAFLGIGFREREDAFALKACVQDFVAYHERMVRAEQLHEEDQRAWRKQEEEEEQGQKKHDADSANTAALPPELYTRVAALGLKEGEKLRISLGRAMEGVAAAGGGSSSSSKHRHTPTLSASSPGGVAAVDAPLLPPPPGDRAPAPMKGVAPTSVVAAAQEMQPARGEGEEEWGDFEVA